MPSLTKAPDDSPNTSSVWNVQLSGYPRALGCTEDGRTMAVGTDDGRVALISAPTGEVVRTLKLSSAPILALAFHKCLNLLAVSGEEGIVWVHDLATEQTTVAFETNDVWPQIVQWHPKHSKLAIAAGRGVRLWSTDGRSQPPETEVESTIAGLSWSPKGDALAVACYGGVRLVDQKSGRVTRRFQWKGSMINLEWSPDGKVIACGCQDSSVHFWRLATGRDSQMSGYPQKPAVIAWSHDSRWLATGGASEITTWNFKKGPEGTAPLQLRAHDLPITALQFAPAVNALASGSRDGEVFMWLPDEMDRPIRRFRLGARIEALQWTLDLANKRMLLVAAAAGGQVAAWPFS